MHKKHLNCMKKKAKKLNEKEEKKTHISRSTSPFPRLTRSFFSDFPLKF